MSVKAIIFDCVNVLNVGRTRDEALVAYTQQLRRSYKIGVLSNLGIGGMDNYFTQAERQRLFDDVVVSSEVGLIKPQPEIFRLAAERLGVEPTEVVFVDDLPDNCAAARAAGMQAIVYTGFAALKKALAPLLQET